MCVPGTKIDDVPVLKYYWATLFSESLELNDILYNKHTRRKFFKGVGHDVNGHSNYTIITPIFVISECFPYFLRILQTPIIRNTK
jgi:hypothetical protein